MEWLGEALSKLPSGYLFAGVLAIVLIGRNGLVPWLTSLVTRRGGRSDKERELLSEDWQEHMNRLEQSIDDERRRHNEDIARYEDILATLRSELRGRDETIKLQAETIASNAATLRSTERGARRIRHALANVLPVLESHRAALRAAGLPVRPLAILGDLMRLEDKRLSDKATEMHEQDRSNN